MNIKCEKVNMNNQSYKKPSEIFNSRYEEINSSAKIILKELKNSLILLKKLGKDADNLYTFGNEYCYTESHKGIVPISGIKKLDHKMENLEWFRSADLELKELIEYFDDTID